MNDDFKILMISSRGSEETVFESQVLDIVRAWQRYGNVSLLYRSRAAKPLLVDEVNISRISLVLPEICRFALHAERWLNKPWRWQAEPDLVHCRGAVGAWQVLHSMDRSQRKSVKVLYDCRGIVVEEMAGAWRDSCKKMLLPLKLRELRRIEEYVVNEVDYLTTVSEGLSDYLEFHYGRRADMIIRPVVNTQKFSFSLSDRIIVRKELGINDDDKLFVFVGGGDYWQSLDLLKNWWGTTQKPNYVLLILSHTPDFFDHWVTDGAVPGRIIVRSVPHNYVSSYLSAADFGILFRDEGLVNNVASPVKLGEYLCSGLKVLTNLSVYQKIQPEDIDVIDLNSNGLICDYENRDASIREIRSHLNKELFSADYAVERLYKLSCS